MMKLRASAAGRTSQRDQRTRPALGAAVSRPRSEFAPVGPGQRVAIWAAGIGHRLRRARHVGQWLRGSSCSFGNWGLNRPGFPGGSITW